RERPWQRPLSPEWPGPRTTLPLAARGPAHPRRTGARPAGENYSDVILPMPAWWGQAGGWNEEVRAWPGSRRATSCSGWRPRGGGAAGRRAVGPGPGGVGAPRGRAGPRAAGGGGPGGARGGQGPGAPAAVG